MSSPYLKMLSSLGIGGAHPGGFLLTKELIDRINLDVSAHILDAGCGTGQTVEFLYHLGYSVIGVDQDAKMIERAKKRFKIGEHPPFIQANLCQLPFSEHSFDTVLSESVLAFTPTALSLPNIHYVLKKNGVFAAIEMVVTTSLTEQEQIELQDFYGFQQFLNEYEWTQLLEKYRFHVQEIIGEMDIDLEFEPTTEFDLSSSIDLNVFDLLQQHETLTKKYLNKLGYRIFICKK
ncbi:class I SAM-dependent methyltransferase [Aeribacillus alveayuensis]|uniref:Ubiquinone/menaquinone biosynthesis C-methylase UbiE n=1 Tax=Aeribacillus alveayuensis TaxID=279215 RepID=A0ABT9VP46_9BACI|nr:ubiquinone/menaquinone biosynthesis C-methylase UbiE [Bacillus alveayuensis]